MSSVKKNKLIYFLLRYMLLSVKGTCYKSLPKRLSKASSFKLKRIRFLYKDSRSSDKTGTIGLSF